jgi:hypothetical protein
VAYAFTSKFEVSSVEQLERRLSRVSKEVAPAVRKSNRRWAAKLRDLIRAKVPRGSGAKYGPRHTTPKGALRRSVRSGATADSAYVKGGGTVPHFFVNEFGGGVRWTNGRTSHGIPIKPRNPQGYFFFPETRQNVDEIATDAVHEAETIIRENLSN